MIAPVSGSLWKSEGKVFLHSLFVDNAEDTITDRWATNLSHTKYKNTNTAVNETILPKEEMRFHFM